MAFSSFPLSLAFFIFLTKLSENLSYAFDSFKLKSLLVALSDKLLIFEIVSKNQISAIYEKNSLNFGEIINYFNQNNIKIEDISTDDGDFEDVFIQLTKN